MTTRDEIQALMYISGFARAQRGSQYNLERVGRLIQIVQAAAYEQAAKICDEGGAWRTPGHCAKLIRTLKDSA